jgi:predicted transcriptional regulator
VLRGWTSQEFAVATGLTPASIYSALRGHKVRDRTALKIFRALARREAIPVGD